MSNTIRKLLGCLLIACLLFSSASALAQTGTLTVIQGTKGEFTDPSGVQFELYRVGVPTGKDSSWGPTEAFSGVEFPVVEDPDEEGRRVWSDEQVRTMVEQIEAALSVEGKPDPDYTPTTDKDGKAVLEGVEPGIYYGIKTEGSSPERLTVIPFLVAMPTLNADDPYDVSVDVKFSYDEPKKMMVSANKVWEDDEDYDEIRSDDITVYLLRNGDKVEGSDQVLNKDNKWSCTWTDLDESDCDYNPYTYTVDEAAVPGGYEMMPIAYSTSTVKDKDNPDKEYPIINGTITNVHTPEYGAIRVIKKVTANNEDFTTTGTVSDGTYHFTITGPKEYPESKNYLDNLAFTITIKNGQGNSWTHDKLKPGTYDIVEDTSKLPNGMTALNSGKATVVVEAGTTAEQPCDGTITNDQKVGSLKIIKKVTLNGSATTSSDLNGTYHFKVTGPSYDPGYHSVHIKVTNGKSDPVRLDNLKIGKYTVTELTDSLPSGVTYISGSGSKEVTATNDKDNPVTFTITNNHDKKTPPPGGGDDPPPSVSPSPTPSVDISGRKVWNDESDAHKTRPKYITVKLLRNGEEIDSTRVSGSGNSWSYSFNNLPKVDESGDEYKYTVDEIEVSGYVTNVDGTTIVNDLIPSPPKEYTNLNGTKRWKDNGNASGQRPNLIVVRLLRDGKEIAQRTVTAASGWQYTFQNLPVDDGYGNKYKYTIREDPVEGYFSRVAGLNLENDLLPSGKPYTPPFNNMNEEDLEDLAELFDYGTPLWGGLLKTGDELPIYPLVFGGIGAAALIALVVMMVLGKKKGRGAA